MDDPKVYSYAKDLENFFESQLRKLLPKYAKSLNLKIASSQLSNLSFHDFMDDIEDPHDSDYLPSNNKRKRSTPSI